MRKKNIVRNEEFTDGEIVEAWSKKRVFAAIVVFVILAGAGWYSLSKVKQKATQVLGVESQKASKEVKLPSKDDVNGLLDQAKQELNHITSDNLTSSQAALQKIIQDLQTIQKGKENPVDVLCHTVCGK